MQMCTVTQSLVVRLAKVVIAQIKSGFNLSLLHVDKSVHRILNPRSDSVNSSEMFGAAT